MLWLLPAAWAYEPVDHAVAVHLSASGLDRLGQGLAGVLPTELAVGDMTGSLACDDTQPDVTLDYVLSGLSLLIDVDDVAIVPTAGRLDVTVYGTLGSTDASFTTTGSCSVLSDLDETCSILLPTTAFQLHLGLALALVDGAVDATVDDVSLTLPPIGNPLDGCTLSAAIGTLLGRDESAITNLILTQVQPSLDDLGPTLEDAVESATAALPYTTSFALGDATLGLSLSATELAIDEDGVFLGLGATVDSVATSDCVPVAAEPTGSDAWPTMTGTAPDGALTYDAAVALNSGFVDQLIHAVYSSGTLCIQGSDLGGFSLTTSLFGATFGDAWTELFPDSAPLTLDIRPTSPPTITFSATGAPFQLQLNGLPVRGYADLDGRQVKGFGLDLTGTVGVDVPYADGALTPALSLDPVLLGMQEEDHELLPVGYADAMVDLLPTLIGAALPADLLPTVTLPTWQGIGLGQLWWMPDQNSHWVVGSAVLDVDDVEPLTVPGCEGGSLGCGGSDTGGSSGIDLGSALGCSGTGDTGSTSGCGDSGCSGSDSGCGTSGGCATVGVRPALALMALTLAGMRRRRR